MDDATSAITSRFRCEQEGTASSFSGLSETILTRGLFSSFYTDRGSHYVLTPTAGEKVDKDRLTQVGRGLKDLKIEHIPSYSPQARGRMERVWDTLQKRLPPQLRREGIKMIEAANRWLCEAYLAQHNARFAVRAAEEGYVVSLADYDRGSNRFANVRSARDAEIRNAKAMADQIRTRIASSLATL